MNNDFDLTHLVDLSDGAIVAFLKRRFSQSQYCTNLGVFSTIHFKSHELLQGILYSYLPICSLFFFWYFFVYCIGYQDLTADAEEYIRNNKLKSNTLGFHLDNYICKFRFTPSKNVHLFDRPYQILSKFYGQRNLSVIYGFAVPKYDCQIIAIS